MEGGTMWGTWFAYIAIGVFLALLLAVFLRTMMLFGTLTLMPIARVFRRLQRIGRRDV